MGSNEKIYICQTRIKYDGADRTISHCMIEHDEVTVHIPPFRVVTLESRSRIWMATKEFTNKLKYEPYFELISETAEIHLGNQDKLLKRIKNLVIFT